MFFHLNLKVLNSFTDVYPNRNVIINKCKSYLINEIPIYELKKCPRSLICYPDICLLHWAVCAAQQIGSYTGVGVICVKQLEKGQRIGASYFKLQSHFLSGFICILRWIPIASGEQSEQGGRSRGPVLRFDEPDDSHRQKHLSHIKVGGNATSDIKVCQPSQRFTLGVGCGDGGKTKGEHPRLHMNYAINSEQGRSRTWKEWCM